MSRPESKISAAGPAPDAAELVAAYEAQLASARGDRRDAIARLLSAAPDWREARDLLGGAFASGDAKGNGDDALRDAKDP